MILGFWAYHVVRGEGPYQIHSQDKLNILQALVVNLFQNYATFQMIFWAMMARIILTPWLRSVSMQYRDDGYLPQSPVELSSAFLGWSHMATKRFSL